MWSKVPSILKNKYFLAFLAAFVWLVFFDNHNLLQQWRMQRQLKELRREGEFYRQQIEHDSLAIDKLKNDPDAIERYAREQYMMRREGEDVFIIED